MDTTFLRKLDAQTRAYVADRYMPFGAEEYGDCLVQLASQLLASDGLGVAGTLRTSASLLKLFQWGDLAEAEYLAERGRVNRAVEALGPDEPTPRINEEALLLAETVGTAWQFASAQTRGAFLTEWFSEVRLRADGGLDVVPREAVREVVCAAAPGMTEWGGPVGSTGLERVRRIS